MANFPLPQSIQIRTMAGEICDQGKSCNPYEAYDYIKNRVNHYSQKEPAQNELIDLREASDYVKKTNYGHTLSGPLEARVFTYIQNKFFGGSPFDGSHATFNPLVVKLDRFSDGDTAVANKARVNGQFVDQKLKMRLCGGDSAESYRGPDNNPNPKYDSYKKYIWLLLKERFQFGINYSDAMRFLQAVLQAGSDQKKLEALWNNWISKQDKDDLAVQRMIGDRIAYHGNIAGVVAKTLVKKHLNDPFTYDPSYNRVPKDPQKCNTVEFIDQYGRNLGRLRAGLPEERRNLFSDFIQNELPAIMEKEGKEFYNFFHDGTLPEGAKPKSVSGQESGTELSLEAAAPSNSNGGKGSQQENWYDTPPEALTENGKRILAALKTSKPELYEILSPDSLPKPWEIFTKERCRELANEWDIFVKQHPEMNNDILAMETFLGIAYAYPKYADQFTEGGVAAETLAMHCSHEATGGKPFHGLYMDQIFKFMQPNDQTSPLFARFKAAISRGAELRPEDCCTFLLRTGQDRFGHCASEAIKR